MGLFSTSTSQKQQRAIGCMGHHLRSRDSEVRDSLEPIIGASIAFATPPALVISGSQTWLKAYGAYGSIRGISSSDREKCLLDFSSPRHLEAMNELQKIVSESSEASIYIALPVYVQELILRENDDASDIDEITSWLISYATSCIRDSASSYIDSRGKNGLDEVEFVLKSFCFAGAVLRLPT